MIFLFTAVITQVYSQRIAYDYDAAGNRISRRIVSLPPQNVKGLPSDSVAVEQMFGERSVLVYPNPTKGALGVEIRGDSPDEVLRLILYSGQGVVLFQADVRPGINSVNMTACPKGWYILRVQAGEKRKEFKVIKE